MRCTCKAVLQGSLLFVNHNQILAYHKKVKTGFLHIQYQNNYTLLSQDFTVITAYGLGLYVRMIHHKHIVPAKFNGFLQACGPAS